MILILMQSRSGSSLVASIFHAHGYRVNNRKREANGFGYHQFEDLQIKSWLKNNKYRMNYRTGEFVEFIPGMRVPKNATVKIGIEYWPIFRPLNPKVFTVSRKAENIAKSLSEKNRRGGNPLPVILRRNEMLDMARDEANGADIDVDQLIAGDFSGIEQAFNHHGLEFNEELARSCVDPRKWHFR